MPRRSMPGVKPAPRFERAGTGAPGRKTPQPAPWRSWIFSSRVICLITRSARSSGESDLFIHGKADAAERVCGAATGTQARKEAVNVNGASTYLANFENGMGSSAKGV